MSELSIFIDESGDFGPYDFRSPYYIITMVFHDQSADISGPLAKLEQDLTNRGFPNHCIHTGPIIRRENEYEFETIQTRRRILNSMVTFISTVIAADLPLQAADMFCSMELIRLKVEASAVSASELEFFGNVRDLKKNYLNPLDIYEWK